MNINREELAWAAGFFDGEGCVSIVRGSPTRPPKSIRIGISQVDRRVLDRFRRAIGCGYIHGPTKRYGTSRPQFRFVAQHHTQTQAICGMLWRWLSPVKREQVTRCLTAICSEMRRASPCPHGVRRAKCVPCNRARGQRRTATYRAKPGVRERQRDYARGYARHLSLVRKTAAALLVAS